MRQAGIVAAAGVYALDHHVERLADDHARARRLASGWPRPGLAVELDRVETNFVQIDVSPLARRERGARAARGSGRRAVRDLRTRRCSAPSRTSTSTTRTSTARSRRSGGAGSASAPEPLRQPGRRAALGALSPPRRRPRRRRRRPRRRRRRRGSRRAGGSMRPSQITDDRRQRARRRAWRSRPGGSESASGSISHESSATAGIRKTATCAADESAISAASLILPR